MKSSLTLKLHPLQKNMNLRTANLFEKLFFLFLFALFFKPTFHFLNLCLLYVFFIGLFKILTTILLGQLIANAKKRKQVNPHNLFFSRRQNTLCSS